MATELSKKINNIKTDLRKITVERYEEIHGLMLAILTNSNILFLGSPGVAKSYLANRFIKHLTNGKYFDRLLTAFSTPEELFGPVSFKGIKEDKYIRQIEGMMPASNISFLDEIFKANSGIINSLLELMNERTFSNGLQKFKTNILTILGASNEIPDKDENLDALYDRFHFKFETKPIQEPGNFMMMMELPDEEDLPSPEVFISLEEIYAAREEVKKVVINEKIISLLTKLRNEFNNDGLFVTDRTYKKSKIILKAEAYLKGSDEVKEDDMDILRHVYWQDPKDIKKVHSKILDLVNPEKNKILIQYEAAMQLVKEVFAEKDPKLQMEKGMEAAAKLKKVRKNIETLMISMETQGKNIEEVKILLNDIEVQQRKVWSDACGIDIGNFK